MSQIVAPLKVELLVVVAMVFAAVVSSLEQEKVIDKVKVNKKIL